HSPGTRVSFVSRPPDHCRQRPVPTRRSSDLPHPEARRVGASRRAARRGLETAPGARGAEGRGHRPDPPAVARAAGCAGGGARSRDRKSTRLNSSHVKISYAVFCLKKKNKELN